MPQNNDTFQRQVSAAIIQLRACSPFFATLTLFARIISTQQLETAATDGRDIFINPRFWQGLNVEERLGLLAHEVLHAALLHVPRRGPRDAIIWNIAADIVVNGIILSQQGFKLPKGHIRDQKLEHLSVEEVYYRLDSQPELRKLLRLLFADLLQPAQGVFRPDELADLQQHWQQATQQATALAETLQHGSTPAGLRRELGHIRPAQLDWRSYLWRFLVQTPTDFQGFDRRFIGQGLYLDALEGEKLRVFVAIDTSGSITPSLIEQFLGEVMGILSSYPHLEALLYYADASCYGPYMLSEKVEVPAPVGGGGTDFCPFFTAIETELNGVNEGLCVYLTDGYGSFPEQPPSLPVLWVLSPGGLAVEQIPFGEAVRLTP